MCRLLYMSTRTHVGAELLGQWECTKMILICVAKLPFVGILPASPLPAMDDSLNLVLAWPCPPNVSFRNCEVGRAKDWLKGFGVLRGNISSDCLLGSGPLGCSLHGISPADGVSSSETCKLAPVALSCEQTAVVLEVRSQWHPQAGLRVPFWQQKEHSEETGPSTHSRRHFGFAHGSLSLLASSCGSGEAPTHVTAVSWAPILSGGPGPCPG